MEDTCALTGNSLALEKGVVKDAAHSVTWSLVVAVNSDEVLNTNLVQPGEVRFAKEIVRLRLKYCNITMAEKGVGFLRAKE